MARPADPYRRETILRAATEVFIEQGYSETRLADIAERAGVVISTLYLYFDSKEAMVQAIAQENQQYLIDQLRTILEHLKSEQDVAEFVEIVFAFAAQHRDQIKIYNLDSGLSGVRSGIRTTFGPRLQRGILVIRQLMDEGYIRSYEPEFVIEMLINFVRWLVSMYFSLKEVEVEPFKQFSVQWLSNALLLPHS